ncbi:prepilin peptidase [Hazenella sp. IB182357]|uniref:Prepilin peptidase n=1 Tax=Polycladospora coralii TaxID=2771432 RepID=A0A926NDX3_9BACL|nr:A24 family peptidase [Polycladospora coralii]MBD1371784.1 prepilin peptidase [Polycladospora coralii]MBS7529245.1 prepilin peptidase [Polycladospora coralii]
MKSDVDKIMDSLMVYISVTIMGIGAYYTPPIATWICDKRYDENRKEVGEKWLGRWISLLIGSSMAFLLVREEKWGLFLLLNFILIWLTLILIWTDLRSRRIPNLITYPGIVLFAGYRMLYDFHHFIDYFLVFSITFGLLYVICRVTNGLGVGDAKLLAMASWILGLKGIWLAFWMGSCLALIYWCVRYLLKNPIPKMERIAFAPFLSIGIWLTLLEKDLLWDRYISWFHF